MHVQMFVPLFQVRRQHGIDPSHECGDSARQIAPVATTTETPSDQRRTSVRLLMITHVAAFYWLSQ
jgi:hypothetical protein